MTESEWLSSSDVEALLNHVWGLFPLMEWHERKPTLVFAACGRGVQHLLPLEYGRLLDEMESAADGRSDPDDMKIVVEQAWQSLNQLGGDPSTLAFSIEYGDLRLFGYVAGGMLAAAEGSEPDHVRQQVAGEHSTIVRDIFGNPFRPMTLDPDHLPYAVIDLARTIYDQRAFDRLPELADVLERAGCTNADVLAHCRGQGPHVRGCWVVDLVLGKS